MPNCNLATSAIGPSNLLDPALGLPGVLAPVAAASTASATALSLQLPLPVLQENVFIQARVNSATLSSGIKGAIDSKFVLSGVSLFGLQIPLQTAALAGVSAANAPSFSYGTTGLSGAVVAGVSVAQGDMLTKWLPTTAISLVTAVGGSLLGRQLEVGRPIVVKSGASGSLMDDQLSSPGIAGVLNFAKIGDLAFSLLIGLNSGSTVTASCATTVNPANLTTKTFNGSITSVSSASGSGYIALMSGSAGSALSLSSAVLNSSFVSGAVNLVGVVAPVGKNFTVFKSLIASNPIAAALTERNPLAPTLDTVLFLVNLAGTTTSASTASAGILNVLMPSGRAEGIFNLTNPAGLRAVPPIWLEVPPLAGVSNANTGTKNLSLQVGLTSSLISSSLGVGVSESLNLFFTTAAVACVASAQSSAGKFGVNLRLSGIPAIEAKTDAASGSGKFIINSPYSGSIGISSNATALFLELRVGLDSGVSVVSPGALSVPNGGRLTILGAPTQLATTAVGSALSLLSPATGKGPALLSLGASDYPSQFQEYSRYPIPTGTSLASPVDDTGSPVHYSHSVFGSTVFRVTGGVGVTTDVSVQVSSSQLGSPTQYPIAPDYYKTLVLLRASAFDTSSVQRALFGSLAVSPNVTRVADYANLPRSYTSSVGTMGSGGSSLLASTTATAYGTYSPPTQAPAVLFLGSSLVRHNYNQGASISENVSVATDYYYPSTYARKLAKSRVESTVGSYSEGLSPIYSSPAFRLMTPSQYLQYSAAGAAFQANAAILPQDGATPAARIHASDSMFAFVPLKSGAKYEYSYYHPSSTVASSTVTAAEFMGSGASLEFTVGLTSSAGAVPPDQLYSADADCVLRIFIYPYAASGGDSFVYVDVPVLGISVNDPTRVSVDTSYRWFFEQCLPLGAYASSHSVRSLKDLYSASNNVPSLSSRAVLAVSRPVVRITGDQGESQQALLSIAGDRNLVMGEFSLAISRPDQAFNTDVKVNVEPVESSAVNLYSDSTAPASSVGSFNPNSLHLFIKADGSLACRRSIPSYNGPETNTSLDPILPKVVREFIAASGSFSKVKVGESVIALLSSGATGKKLFLWGYNTYGHLDVPAAVDANFLSQGYISNVKEFDFNAGHIAVILDNGNMYSWGCKTSTVWQSSGSPVSQLDIGENYSVAVVQRYDSANPGTPISAIEQYGTCPPTSSIPSGVTVATPTQVWTATQAGQVVYAGKVLACGKNHTVLLKSDGTVVCWGNNNTYGQCTVPGGLTSIVAVDAGDNHTIALKSDGTVYAWGRNNLGQTSIPSGLKAKIISAGGDFCAAVRTAASTDVSSVVGAITDEEVDNTVACWGDNTKGQCNVPVTEGASYDPTVYKYRSRFWSVQCGWDHVVGIRMDNVQSKWGRDHPELSRYINSLSIAFPLKTSGGTTIFPSVKRLVIPVDTPSVLTSSGTGVTYPVTESSPGSGVWYTAPVTVGSIKYRIRYEASTASSFIERSNVTPTSWSDLVFNIDTYDYYQNVFASTSSNLGGLLAAWSGGVSASGLSLPSWVPQFGLVDPITRLNSAQTTNEYCATDYSVAENQDIGLNWTMLAWGNPIAYTASADKNDYLPYYPDPDISTVLTNDLKQTPTVTGSSSNMGYVFSYVGYGKRLGRDLLLAGENGADQLLSYDNNVLSSEVYLGPRSLQLSEVGDAFTTFNPNTGEIAGYGGYGVMLTVSGTPRYFNRPLPVSASQINVYADPEVQNSGTSRDNLAVGFNNRAVYVEKFDYSLPAGYSIVANGSGSLPAGTLPSPTGYHLLFIGTVAGISRTLVMTGAYAAINPAELLSISLPYDPDYNANNTSGLAFTWLTSLGVTVKVARVIKHSIEMKSDSWSPVPGKHMTSFAQIRSTISNNTALVYGLAISSSSPQVTGGVKSLLNTYVPYSLQYFAKYRSAVQISRTGVTVGPTNNDKFGVIANSFGDNTKGQLDLKLMGPFALTQSDLYSPLRLDSRWMMDYGQANIGHTENPALAYGFSKVTCGQFHTLAIDADGSVHAWGLNYALNPPKTQFISWDPFAFGSTNCNGDFAPAKVSGYFSNIPGEEPGAVSCSPTVTFSCNRSVSVFPAGASNNGNLSSSFFPYPDIFANWNSDSACFGSYMTSGLLLFDIAGFRNSDTVLVSQSVSGPGLKVGLEQANGQGRIYVSEKGSLVRTYSQPFAANPSLVYLSFPAADPIGDPGVSVAAKVNGEYVKWANDSYTSIPVSKLSYRRFLDAVGNISQVSPAYSRSFYREYMPVVGLTKLVAGDSFFAGLYLGDSDPASQVRGTFMSRISLWEYNYSLGVTSSLVQGPMLPTLDLAGPKQYFISKVNRTYKQISGTVPAGVLYSGAVPATIQYSGDANPNFKIYYGAEYAEPAEPMSYSNVDPVSGPGRWPKLVFPTDPEWASGLAYLPTQVKVYRQLGNTYASNEFSITSQGTASNPLIYPVKPVVSTSSELGSYVVYDQASKRLLPQAYYPTSNLTSLPSMYLGERCIFAIKSDNSMVSWGHNHNYQRADADALGFTSWKQVACGTDWGVALSLGGVVRIIGRPGTLLIPPTNLGASLSVAATNSSAAAIVQDGVNPYGSVRCWGYNYFGECNVPADLGACTMISGGHGHFAALRTDGKVVCWGRNDAGQCTVPSTALSNVVKVVCGSAHTVALKSDGSVVCWGSNFRGQCTVPGTLGTGCLDIGAGMEYTVAIKSNGSPRAWGNDDYLLVTNINATGATFTKAGSGWSASYAVFSGVSTTSMFGDTTTYYLSVPTTTSRLYAEFNPTGYTLVGPYKHVAVSLPPGSTQAQIDAAVGQIPVSIRAKNADIAYSSSELSGLEHAIEVAAGFNCFFAIKASTYASTQGTIVGWGQAQGDGLFTLPSGSDFTAISCRNRHAAAIRSDGTLACWGLNTSGQAAAQAGTYSKVSCGDTFTVAIDSTTNKLKAWGSISSIPAPYSNITYSTVSAGRAHIVGRSLSAYSELVAGGPFSAPAGSALAFGDNNSGQCNIPGFSYSPNNNGISCPVVAGGDFTAYSMPSNGFELTSSLGSSGGSNQAAVFTSAATFEDFDAAVRLSDRLEGYVIHRSGALCPPILPPLHPYAINPPTSAIYPNRDPVNEAIQPISGFLPKYSIITNATAVPAAYARGGSKKARLVAAGRYQYYKQDVTRFPYGAGYSVIVGQTNEVVVFGGDLLPSSCNVAQYVPPAEALGIRDVQSSGLTIDDTVVQLDTYRSNIYALKSTGDLVQWGYDDVSTGSNPQFYKVNSSQKQYFSLPDESLVDYLPRMEQYDFSNLAMSYVGGIPGLTESWSVDVFLDRYFDGVRTTLRRFTATGNSSSYPIGSPVHFAETFLALDTWPGTAQYLDSQYVMTLIPRGVNCVVDSASMFLLNLDSKTAGGQRVFNDGTNTAQPADFLLLNQTGSGYGSSEINSVGQVAVTAVNDSPSAITLTGSSNFTYPSYIRNSYGSSARLEYVDGSSRVARTAGRIANPTAVVPTSVSGTSCWFNYSSLSSTPASAISSWSNSVSGGAPLTQGTANLQANVATFNTSYRGAEFDTTSAQIDRMYAASTVLESPFTYFLVFKKTANTSSTHCAFGKYAVPAQNNSKTLGIGFKLGAPVLFTGTTHDIASASVGTSPGVVCGYYGGSTDKGIRFNGSDISSWASQGTPFYLPQTGLAAGYHLGGGIAGANGTTVVSYHDSNDVYAEVVAFERRLTLEEIQIVEGYLSHKFNLQANLPSGHAYKTAPASQDLLDVVQDLTLQDPDMVLESNRLTGNAGNSETWVGMFEVGVSHKSKRTAGGGTVLNNHAPLLAEFNISLGSTLRILTKPVSAALSVAGNLIVDGRTKYLEGRIFSVLSAAGIMSGPQKRMVGAITCSSNTSAAMNVLAGLAGSASSKLQFFGGVDCDGPYGCQGHSDLAPDLTVKSPAPSLQVTSVSTAGGTMGVILTERFSRISVKSAISADTSNLIAMSASSSAKLGVVPASTKFINTDLGFAYVFGNSDIIVCAPNFQIILPSGNRKTTPVPQFPPLPDGKPELGGVLEINTPF